MTRAKRRGSGGARSKKTQEQRWAARSGPVYIVKPAKNTKEAPPARKPDGLDLARAQYARYKIKPKITITPSS